MVHLCFLSFFHWLQNKINHQLSIVCLFVLFNDATGTHWFLSYHRLLDVIHMVTLSHFLEGNPLPPHRLLFSISSKGSFICTFPDRTVHTTAFDKPVVDHWLSAIECQIYWCSEHINKLLSGRKKKDMGQWVHW